MSQFGASLKGTRTWLLAVVVWLVLGTWAYTTSTAYKSSAALAGLLVFLFGAVGLIRTLWPMRATSSRPPRIVAGGTPYDLASYTGWVGSAAKTSSTQFSASSRVQPGVLDGEVHHTLSVNQQVTIQDSFTLHGADGSQRNVQVTGVNLPLGEGQLLSLAWPVRPGAPKYVMFRNHTTGQHTVPLREAWSLAAGRGAVAIVLGLFLGGLLYGVAGHPGLGAFVFVVLPFVYIGLAYYRVARFRGGLGRPLVDYLDSVAATFPTPGVVHAAPMTSAVPSALPAPAVLDAPVPPPPPTTSAPNWHPDPTGRHEHRYWTGTSWSDHVSDAGQQLTDPV